MNYCDKISESASRLVKVLNENSLRVTAAESCTGGLLSSMITSVSGASAVFPGSVVSYQVEIKERIVGVSQSVIESFGVVSRECATAMAEGARAMFSADLAAGITGWAGPGDGDDGQRAGTVCIAVASAKKNEAVCCHFDGDRDAVRHQAAEYALKMLLAAADKQNNSKQPHFRQVL